MALLTEAAVAVAVRWCMHVWSGGPSADANARRSQVGRAGGSEDGKDEEGRGCRRKGVGSQQNEHR